MEKKVPLREVKLYQSDDGRRIECFEKVKDINYVKNPHGIEEGIEELINKNIKAFVGVVHLGTPVGPKEIKFEIPGVTTTEEAFDKFYEFADIAAKEVVQKIEEYQRELENKIYVPGQGGKDIEGGSIIV